jgi:hypothetical protein
MQFKADGLWFYLTNEITKFYLHISDAKIKDYYLEGSQMTYSFDYNACINTFYNNTNYKELKCISFRSDSSGVLRLHFEFEHDISKTCEFADKLADMDFSNFKSIVEGADVCKSITSDQFRGIFMNSGKKVSTAQFKVYTHEIVINVNNSSGNNTIKWPFEHTEKERDDEDDLEPYIDITCEVTLLNIVNTFKFATKFGFDIYDDMLGFSFKERTFSAGIAWNPTNGLEEQKTKETVVKPKRGRKGQEVIIAVTEESQVEPLQ